MLSGWRLEKQQEWTNRFERFENSGSTVVAFCSGEGVSVPSFYYWKKKVRIDARSKTPQSFQPVEFVSSQFVGNPATTIQLGEHVRIELGRDEAIAALVVRHVIDAVVTAAPSATPEGV